MKPGDKIGEYIIEEPISIGKTGQADIYLVRRCDGIGEPMAIKVLAEHLQFDEKSIKNFEEEAEQGGPHCQDTNLPYLRYSQASSFDYCCQSTSQLVFYNSVTGAESPKHSDTHYV